MISAITPTQASEINSRVNRCFTRFFSLAPMLKPTIGMQPAAMPTTMEMTIWKNFITMLTTAMGICANCSWPKMGSSAPQ